MQEKRKKFRSRCFWPGVLLLVMIQAATVWAAPTHILNKGQYTASELKKMGYEGAELLIESGFMNLIMDTDLSLTRLAYKYGNEDLALTITGSHTLTVDCYDNDYENYEINSEFGKTLPAAIKAGSLSVNHTTIYAKGIWYAIFANQNITLKGARIVTDAADVGINADNGWLKISDGCDINCTERNSNPIFSGGLLSIAGSTVTAKGSVTGMRSARGQIRIESGTVNVTGGSWGILAGTDIFIEGGTVDVKAEKEGYYEMNGGISAADGSVVISGGTVRASGSWSGIVSGYYMDPANKTVRILGGSVEATGTKNAISSANGVQIADELTVLSPVGGKSGKTGWNEKLPWGVTATEGTAQKYVKIGPPPAQVSGTVTPEKPVSGEAVETAVGTVKGEKDVKGSSFYLMQARGKARSKTSVRLTWKKVPGATRYIVYGSRCGKNIKVKRLKVTAAAGATFSKLKKGTYYKYFVVAANGSKTLAVSKYVHVATKGGKYGNPKSVSLGMKKLTLKRGKKKTVRAAVKREGLPIQTHRAVQYESSNKAVATVSARGVIKAVAKGKCTVYAYAQNGVYAKLTVTVK